MSDDEKKQPHDCDEGFKNYIDGFVAYMMKRWHNPEDTDMPPDPTGICPRCLLDLNSEIIVGVSTVPVYVREFFEQQVEKQTIARLKAQARAGLLEQV